MPASFALRVGRVSKTTIWPFQAEAYSLILVVDKEREDE